MKEIPLSLQGKNKGKFVALVDDEDYEYLMQWRWSAARYKSTYYAKAYYNKKIVYMHRIIMGENSELIIDHKDRNGLNNQKVNLRFCTNVQNLANTPPRNKYGIKGLSVSPKPNGGIQISAKGTCGGEHIHLGSFQTLDDAARAYDRWAHETFGEFAYLNFPEEWNQDKQAS